MADTPDLKKLIETALRQHFTTCFKCRRPVPTDQAQFADWGLRHFLMIPVGLKCPDCQSAEERAECVIRQASGVTYHFEGLQLVQDDPKPTEDDGPDDEEHPRTA